MPETQTQHQPQAVSLAEDRYGLSNTLSKQIIHALEENNQTQARELLADQHAADIADLLSVLPHDLREALIEAIKATFDPDILVELDNDIREEIIELLGTHKSAHVISELETDDAVEVLSEMDEENQQELLQAIPKEQREILEESLAYPEDSAGRLVEKNLVAVPEFWSVGETIDYLRNHPNLPEDFYQVFVVDPKHKPIGAATLSRIIRSRRDIKIKDIMETDLKVISTDTDQEEVAFIFRQYGLSSAPVVNEEGRMIGVISIDDVINVVEEEAHEDIMHLGGVSGTDLHSHVGQTVQRRFPWLFINLLTAIAASIIIALFQGAIQKMAALAVLMPIMASMGGNAGTQTLTIIIRALATKELTATNAFRVVGKEAFVGITNGLLFAVICGGITYLWLGNPAVSVILALAAITTLFAAALAGATIPLILERFGADPAISSSIFLTTVTDMTAFGVFLGLATIVLT